MWVRRKDCALWDPRGKTAVYKSGLSYPEVIVRLCRQKCQLGFYLYAMASQVDTVTSFSSLNLSCQRNQRPLPPNCLKLIIAQTVVSPGLKEALIRYCSLVSHLKGSRQCLLCLEEKPDEQFAFLLLMPSRALLSLEYGDHRSGLWLLLFTAISLLCVRIKTHARSPAAWPYV